MGGRGSEQTAHDLVDELDGLGEGPAVGLLGLVASAWAQLPMDVAAAASPPPLTESDVDSARCGSEEVAVVRGAWTSGSR
jgi:hypothetical protein